MTLRQTVYVVDDDEAVRDSLQWLLSPRGLNVETFDSAESFLERCDGKRSGCIVLDVRMPDMSGLELHERLNARGSRLPIIFITGHGDVPMAVGALKKGAVDFIEKPFNDRELLGLVENALRIDAERCQRQAAEDAAASRMESLTQREQEVMARVVTGKLNKLIAEDLGISIKTVEAHRARIMEKLGVRSVAELVQLAIASGMVAPGE